VSIGPTDDPEFVGKWADAHRSPPHTVALISNEEPLAAGIADLLNGMGIPTIGPTKELAQIETSKSFTRKLLHKHEIVGSPHWEVFEPGEINRVESFMYAFGEYVIKPDGLTGGKGVMVKGDHFHTMEEGLHYCGELFAKGGKLLIEQKHEGQEFSLMSFSDGNIVVDMPPVQDHKRLLDRDFGPNTGGMGSYSNYDHSLPILNKYDLSYASYLNRRTIHVLQEETGQPYKGILYGNYMITSSGLKIIEYNARFGDPEVMNVLPLLSTDFADILFAITKGKLRPEQVRFANKATVCKYLVPIGHPNDPQPGTLDLSKSAYDESVRVYYGALDGDKMTGSRAAAVVGIASTLDMAEKLAEQACNAAVGPVFHRKDIGTMEAVTRRTNHATRLREFR
jgi:phosphoribosylamine--glycine ligase